jgi:hypothetical protein
MSLDSHLTQLITCNCGWATMGSIRENEGKLKIHLKRCEKGRKAVKAGNINDFHAGKCGLSMTRNKNLELKPSLTQIHSLKK